MIWRWKTRERRLAEAKAKNIIKELAQKNGNNRQRLTEKILAIKAARVEAEIKCIQQACEDHFQALNKNFRRHLVYDDYGSLKEDSRRNEAAAFIDSLDLSTLTIGNDRAECLIVTTVEQLAARGKAARFCPSSFPENGHDFEYWAAESLRKFGWKAKVTQGSGDQGVDVVAHYLGHSVGIQCKRYSGSVGNKAIQEVYSGVKHLGLDTAAVLSNAPYTKSAKELAVSTGVMLLSPEDIPNLNDMIELGR